MKNEDDEEYKRFYKMRKITASVLMSIDNSFKRLMDVAFLTFHEPAIIKSMSCSRLPLQTMKFRFFF